MFGEKTIKEIIKCIFIFIIAGITYYLIEIMWRGYSHYTMFILGGMCGLAIDLLNEQIEWDMPFWKQLLLGTIIVVILEFIAGCFLNIWLNLNIWDYSSMQFNILGQICPQYILLWIPLVAFWIVAADLLRFKICKEEKPRYRCI